MERLLSILHAHVSFCTDSFFRCACICFHCVQTCSSVLHAHVFVLWDLRNVFRPAGELVQTPGQAGIVRPWMPWVAETSWQELL